MNGTVRTILMSLQNSPKAPGDVVSETRLPRYLVLASFRCLEELGLIETLYSRGSYKLYVLTEKGQGFLEDEEVPSGINEEEGEAAA
ncbi:MAG: ArsR family transcriptional regulator [Desulfurococcales archaeon]|nr:ArsR family transcriptional regulator [Desulfurococcales archaeon]